MALPRAVEGPSPVPISPANHAQSSFHEPDSPHAQSACMLELLEVIQKKVHLLTTHLGHSATPRYAVNDDEQMQNHRRDLLSATQSLHDLTLGPRGILESIHANDVVCMQAIHRYQIASHVPSYGTISFEKLSMRCKLNVSDLKRLLRLVMTRTVFCEPQVGFVAHTAASRLLKEDPQARDFSGIICDERFPASAQTVNALQKFGKSERPCHSGFSLANNTSSGLYEELAKFPVRQARWTSAMSAMANRISFDFLMQYFPLKAHDSALIVDVAGGSGTVSIGLAPHYPNARFIVQDTPSTISALKPPTHLIGRIEYREYDLFTPQSIQGANIYFFRNIFHNWPDKSCVEILRNHIPAMRPGSKLVIDDFTLHQPLTLDLWDERRRRSMDITMLIYFGSRERTLGEWRHLLREADERFELVTTGRAEREPNTIFVVEWRG